MQLYTLTYGTEIVGIFDNKGDFKQKTFHFILDKLLENNLFVNKKECGLAIKSDLKALYSTDNYSFGYHGHVFSKITSEPNQIRYISIPQQYSATTKFIVFRPDDLQKPLKMLTIDDLIVKN